MRLRKRDARRIALALGLLTVASCRDGVAYLPFGALCEARASDLCEARASCCAPEDQDACLMRETTACEAVKAQLEAEALRFDAEQAARTRSEQREQLDACGAVPALASLFRGGLALGAACARGAECASGSCAGAPPVCVAGPARALCAAP